MAKKLLYANGDAEAVLGWVELGCSCSPSFGWEKLNKTIRNVLFCFSKSNKVVHLLLQFFAKVTFGLTIRQHTVRLSGKVAEIGECEHSTLSFMGLQPALADASPYTSWIHYWLHQQQCNHRQTSPSVYIFVQTTV